MAKDAVTYTLRYTRAIKGVKMGVYEVFEPTSHEGNAVKASVGYLVAPTAVFARHGEEHDGDRGLTQPREPGGGVAVATAANEGGELDTESLRVARAAIGKLDEKFSTETPKINTAPAPSNAPQSPPPLFISTRGAPMQLGLMGVITKRLDDVAKNMEMAEDIRRISRRIPRPLIPLAKTPLFDEVSQVIDGSKVEGVTPDQRNALVAAICRVVDLQALRKCDVTADHIEGLILAYAPGLMKTPGKVNPATFDMHLLLAEMCADELSDRRTASVSR